MPSGKHGIEMEAAKQAGEVEGGGRRRTEDVGYAGCRQQRQEGCGGRE